MAQNRYYSSTAKQTTLSASVTNTATSISVAAITGFPTSFPYMLCVDPGQTAEELMLVSASVGTGPYTLTVSRGVDGTTAVAHSSGAVVRHSYAALDFTEAGQHIGTSASVHGITGSVVGTNDSQTLTNKTINGGTIIGRKFNASATNTSNLYANQWALLARSSITAQFADTTVMWLLNSTGNGSGYANNARITARVKQQAAMGSPPAITIYVESISNFDPTDIIALISQNDATATVVDFYFRDTMTYDTLYLYEESAVGSGSPSYYTNASFASTLPAGTQVTASTGNMADTFSSQTLTNKTISAGTAATIAAIIKGTSGQSSDLTQWQDSTGAELAKVDHTGQISSKVGIVMDDGFPTGLRAADATYPELFVQLGINSPTNQRTMIVRATKNQTSALLELQDLNGNTLMYFDNNGYPWFTQTNAGLEIGSQTAANTPYIDFHSSGGTVDYDVRILASGGSTTSGGQGNLGFYAGNVIFNGPVQFNDNIQDANARKLPRGRVGTTKVTSNSAAITTTGGGVQVASCAFTAQAGHRYVIRASGLVQCATAANSFNVRILDPTGTSVAQFQDTCNAANFGYGFNLEGDYVAGSNGSVSAALYLAAINSAAAVTALGNASFPLTLVVEDVGS